MNNLKYSEAPVSQETEIWGQTPYNSQSPVANNFFAEQTQYAGFWIRLGAYLIDVVITFVPLYLIQLVIPNPLSIVSTIVYALYAAILAGPFRGATPGKKVLGLRVVDELGNTPGFGQLFLRYSLGYFISGIILAIGFIMIGTGEQKQGLHDKMFGTYVVRQ